VDNGDNEGSFARSHDNAGRRASGKRREIDPDF
jgi:hypothetical protein